jgi:hypothetical protein
VRSQRRPKQQKKIKIMKNMKILLRQKILIMRHNKFFAAAIALCVMAFFTMASVPSASASTPTPVTITGTYDFSTFPDVTGTFTTTGALTISGDTTMHIGPNYNGTIAHCVVTLIAPDGVIIIHQECQFATSPPAGRWEIVSGTGAYANLRGNGSLTMPEDEEAMTGFIYQ